MNTNEIIQERKKIEEQNSSLRQRLKTQRQHLEDYLAEAARYSIAMKNIEKQITDNNDRYYELGKQLRSS